MVMPASSATPSSSALERLRRGIEAIAIGVERAGEHQRQPGRAVFQVLQRLLVGRLRIGMVDALHHRPGGAGLASGDRLGARRARIKRLDPQAVIGLADQPLVERRALSAASTSLRHSASRGRRKFGGEGESFVGHSAQSATVAAQAVA